MNEGKQTFKELLVGVAVFGLVLVLLGVIWTGDKLAYYLGLFIGLAASFLLVFDMYQSIAKGVWLENKQASSYFKKKAMIRILLAAIILVVAAVVDQIHINLEVLGVSSAVNPYIII